MKPRLLRDIDSSSVYAQRPAQRDRLEQFRPKLTRPKDGQWTLPENASFGHALDIGRG